MKQEVKKRLAFVGKSMLWSVLLYLTMTLVFNWDDVSNAVTGNNAITIVANTPLYPCVPGGNPHSDGNISSRNGVMRGIVTFVKIVSGVAEVMEQK